MTTQLPNLGCQRPRLQGNVSRYPRPAGLAVGSRYPSGQHTFGGGVRKCWPDGYLDYREISINLLSTFHGMWTVGIQESATVNGYDPGQAHLRSGESRYRFADVSQFVDDPEQCPLAAMQLLSLLFRHAVSYHGHEACLIPRLSDSPHRTPTGCQPVALSICQPCKNIDKKMCKKL